jgi:hypothetical protein
MNVHLYEIYGFTDVAIPKLNYILYKCIQPIYKLCTHFNIFLTLISIACAKKAKIWTRHQEVSKIANSDPARRDDF